ncbi:carbohydrate sulfotransferase 11-like [Penaeus japonicus]|uniref:carbohydrate sulfotransferase 11-like n=1 Tax=Penaeus japonicus TaxID=27405 RepID=UPI001C70FA3E|nr:carbohydrate sulfotransferase 11-like [Penaeus japonicus]
MKRRRLLILLVFGFVAGVFFNTQSKKPEREPNFSIKAKKIINVKPAVLSKRKPVSKIEFPHKPDVQPRAKALDEDMTSSLTINPAALRRRGHEEAMGDLMKERMSYLRRQCNATNAKQVKAAYKWSKRVVLRATGFFSVCATPKGGSTSWRHLTWRMPDDVVGRSPPLHILNVRHPLARLASAYRDKYLGGLPLYKYDQEWRERIKSRMPWSNEWETFWFPALAFRGAFPLRPNLRLRARNATYWANVDHGGVIYRVLRNYYGKSAFGLRYHFRNASFTFEDFLRYVVWTHDVGYMNKHWAPLVFLCNPCKHRYDFIVHLETIAPEFNYIMTFLNYTEGIQMEEQHKTKATNRSDIHLYKDIPRDVMKRILEIYKFDFELFGYRYPFQ